MEAETSPRAPKLWTLRYLEDSTQEESPCGFRYRLLSTGDETSAFAHLVRIYESTPHYHKQTTELYFVVEGSGTITLDGEEVPLRSGACLEMKPGVVHSVRGNVLVLVIGIPSITDGDLYYPEGVTADAGDELNAPQGHLAARTQVSAP